MLHAVTSQPPSARLMLATDPERPPSHRQLIAAGSRALIGAMVLVAVYYVVPDSVESAPSVVLRIVISGVVVAAMLAWQIRAIVEAELPLLRAVEALALTVTLMVVGFASFYIQVSKRDPTAFNDVLNRTGALYFTMTTLTTIGYGDIHARTDGARIAVMVQMLFNVLVIGASIKLILHTARRRVETGPRTPPATPADPYV
jgi:voltage-gated potassium channel